MKKANLLTIALLTLILLVSTSPANALVMLARGRPTGSARDIWPRVQSFLHLASWARTNPHYSPETNRLRT